MKYFLAIAATLMILNTALASDGYCTVNAWFASPTPFQTFAEGTDLTVRVNTTSTRHIVYMYLRLKW